jgi:NAD-dependent DNA ligase adenylation domain
LTNLNAIQKQWAEMNEEVRKARIAYYYGDEPIMSDSQFDYLFRKLKKFEADWPEHVTPDQTVAVAPLNPEK